MKKSEKKQGFYSYLALVLILVAALAMIGSNLWLISKDYLLNSGNSGSSLLINFKKGEAAAKTKAELVVQLKEMEQKGKFGNWPLVLSQIQLSSDRSNPFIKKVMEIINNNVDNEDNAAGAASGDLQL